LLLPNINKSIFLAAKAMERTKLIFSLGFNSAYNKVTVGVTAVICSAAI